jgi:hypothetical protein
VFKIYLGEKNKGLLEDRTIKLCFVKDMNWSAGGIYVGFSY